MEYIYTNIFITDLPLQPDEKAGLGQVTLVISPGILKYKIGYYNRSWMSNVSDKSVIMNEHLEEVLEQVKKDYRYPHITTHEVLFRYRISIELIEAIICEPEYTHQVQKVLDRYHFPIEIRN